MKLTEKHESAIVNGMRIAAEEYAKIAKQVRAGTLGEGFSGGARESFALQFERQQREATEIADGIQETGIQGDTGES